MGSLVSTPTGRKAVAWKDGIHHLTATGERQVRHAAQAALQTFRAGYDSRTVAAAAEQELVGADWFTRQRASALLAGLVAKGKLVIDLGALDRALADHDRFLEEMARSQSPQPARRISRQPTREPLPLEAARAKPIVDLCERLGLTLRRAGRDYETRCPFCGAESRSRNLRVYPRSRTGAGRFYCFSCQARGDGIALVMQLKGLDFADAVREVAA